MAVRNLLEEPHSVVGEVSDRARRQRRKLRVRVEAGLDREALERVERLSRDRPFLAAPLLEDPVGFYREPRNRTASEKRVARDGLASRSPDALSRPMTMTGVNASEGKTRATGTELPSRARDRKSPFSFSRLVKIFPCAWPPVRR